MAENFKWVVLLLLLATAAGADDDDDDEVCRVTATTVELWQLNCPLAKLGYKNTWKGCFSNHDPITTCSFSYIFCVFFLFVLQTWHRFRCCLSYIHNKRTLWQSISTCILICVFTAVKIIANGVQTRARAPTTAWQYETWCVVQSIVSELVIVHFSFFFLSLLHRGGSFEPCFPHNIWHHTFTVCSIINV